MVEATDRSRLVVPGLGNIYDGLGLYAYPFLRLCFGVFFIPHGWSKIVNGTAVKYNEAGDLVGGTAAGMAKMGFPAPELLAYYIGCLELVGGFMLAIGLLTRLMAIQFAVFMAVAAFVVHSGNWFWTARGMEMPLILLAIAIVVLIRGGGALSVDNKISKEL